MEVSTTWLIVIGIGLVTAFVVHALMRMAQGSSIFTTLLLGVIGALAAAYYIAPYINIADVSAAGERFTAAFLGALVLSLIAESLYAGSRRGRVYTT